MENTYLGFIKFIGTDINGLNSYSLIFTDKIDEFWGENFEYMPCCLCNELIPYEEHYSIIKNFKTPITLNLIQNSCCFSYQDAIDGIVAIAYEDISEYDEYPENGRLILKFGDSYDNVIQKLEEKDIKISD